MILTGKIEKIDDGKYLLTPEGSEKPIFVKTGLNLSSVGQEQVSLRGILRQKTNMDYETKTIQMNMSFVGYEIVQKAEITSDFKIIGKIDKVFTANDMKCYRIKASDGFFYNVLIEKSKHNKYNSMGFVPKLKSRTQVQPHTFYLYINKKEELMIDYIIQKKIYNFFPFFEK